MNYASVMHDTGHSLGLMLFGMTTPWFEFVLHTVLIVAPLALAVVVANWALRLYRRVTRHMRRGRGPRQGSQSSRPPSGVVRYVLKYTRRGQLRLMASALVALPLLYAGLELPKQIINGAISSGHFPVELAGYLLNQTQYLFLLCALYLAVIVANTAIKYEINVHKGRVGEALLRRLRLTIYRYWRRDTSERERTQVIPMLVQEVEPVGGFAGDVLVLPLFQGGTFLVILAFMFLQNPVLGAAAVTLLPLQLLLIPRLQVKINNLTRRRAREMRALGGSIGTEATSNGPHDASSRRQVTASLRRIEDIRFQIYRKKFWMKGLNNFLTNLAPFFFYTVGGYLVIDGRLTFGALIAVLAAHKDFSSPLKELLKYYQMLEDVRVRFAEVRAFLATGERTSSAFSRVAATV